MIMSIVYVVTYLSRKTEFVVSSFIKVVNRDFIYKSREGLLLLAVGFLR